MTQLARTTNSNLKKFKIDGNRRAGISYERHFIVSMKLSVAGREQEEELDTGLIPYEIKDISSAEFEVDSSWFSKPQTWIVILIMVMASIGVYSCVKRREKNQRQRQQQMINAY